MYEYTKSLQPLQLDIDNFTGNTAPVTLSLAKTHLGIESQDFDSYILDLIYSAVEQAEGLTHRSLFARSHKWILRNFPIFPNYEIRLPRGKTQSVQSIEYVSDGSTVTLTGPSSDTPGTDYQESLEGDSGAVLTPSQDGCWPAVDCDAVAPVTINFTAGYTANTFPASMKKTLLWMVSDGFDIRGTSDLTPGLRPDLAQSLLNPYSLARVY